MAYEPRFHISPALLTRLEGISALRERILGAAVQVPWIPSLRKDARARNTHASTAIEGNPLTLEEVRALEEGRSVKGAGERSRREVLNYLAGLRFIEKRPQEAPVTHEDILALHRIIAGGAMDQGLAGRYRDMRVRVGRHIPPRPEEVRSLMTDLLDWWNGPSREWTPVVSSAVLHFRFEEIHPFADGNGRAGRAQALWELYRRGFDTHHIFSVDEFFWEHRPRYYAELDAAGRGDLTGWLEFSAEAVHATLEAVQGRMAALRVGDRKEKLVLRPRQEKLMTLLKERGALAPREIWKALGVSRQGAMDLLRPLMAAGLVRREGTRKSGRYLPG
jgi:Fic family protein